MAWSGPPERRVMLLVCRSTLVHGRPAIATCIPAWKLVPWIFTRNGLSRRLTAGTCGGRGRGPSAPPSHGHRDGAEVGVDRAVPGREGEGVGAAEARLRDVGGRAAGEA